MRMFKRLHICGPMGGYPNFNKELFLAVEEKLENDYLAEIFNPARIDEHGEMTPEECLYVCLSEIKKANIVFMLPKWEKSFGAKCEHALIETINSYRPADQQIEIVYITEEELESWGFVFPEKLEAV